MRPDMEVSCGEPMVDWGDPKEVGLRQHDLVGPVPKVGDRIDLGGEPAVEDELIVALSSGQSIVTAADIDLDPSSTVPIAK
jgi:hypothetical protein